MYDMYVMLCMYVCCSVARARVYMKDHSNEFDHVITLHTNVYARIRKSVCTKSATRSSRGHSLLNSEILVVKSNVITSNSTNSI